MSPVAELGIDVYKPGNLVKARGREWVVQKASEDYLALRPLGGSEADIVELVPSLERLPVEPASFPQPDTSRIGNLEGGQLLRDVLMLKLRSCAGPFRSFGRISVEPRSYQLVPLLMALKLNPVRLLIADDVGIGKTIEAGLILRELLDQGEISNFAVLCPPHLVEQWQQELETHFHIPSVGLTSRSANRLERNLPRGTSLFDHHQAVVVSLDYIKTEAHREHFITAAPEMIVVDEAHASTKKGKGRQLRFELLQRLTQDDERHLIMLTATPHSGDDEAFFNLLSLLDRRFIHLRGDSVSADDPLRQRLARHFVQRRRQDIEHWEENRVFPVRKSSEVTYKLTGPWGEFFDSVLDYSIGLASRAERERNENQARLIWYATLALLRCVASSPAAARATLSKKLSLTVDQESQEPDESLILDGKWEDENVQDIEPASVVEEDRELKKLIQMAEKLQGTSGDPKLKALEELMEDLLKRKLRPVVFCRYIASAHYVGDHLRKSFKKHIVDVVTGEYTPEEREEKVALLAAESAPILVATDCLSEGINLQDYFDSVVHYDLAWNPNRHEQREGRVDRFGQKAAEVYCSIIYGEDNPVDGFVLNVLIRKAEAIKKELGVLVPLPEEDRKIQQAMIKAALMKSRRDQNGVAQGYFEFGDPEEELKAVEILWQDAKYRARLNRTIFAQSSLKPAEVLPEFEKQAVFLGRSGDVERFITRSMSRLGAPLQRGSQKEWLLSVSGLADRPLRERLEDLGLTGRQKISFSYGPGSSGIYIARSHPLVEVLADHVLEGVMEGSTHLASRTAVGVVSGIEKKITLFLCRIRHQLLGPRGTPRGLAEETLLLGFEGAVYNGWMEEEKTRELLDLPPAANATAAVLERQAAKALDTWVSLQKEVEQEAGKRTDILLADHRRVRSAARARSEVTAVVPALPVDLMGLFVLLPHEL